MGWWVDRLRRLGGLVGWLIGKLMDDWMLLGLMVDGFLCCLGTGYCSGLLALFAGGLLDSLVMMSHWSS